MSWANPQWTAYVTAEKDALEDKGKSGLTLRKGVSDLALLAYVEACSKLPSNSAIGIRKFLRTNGPVSIGSVQIERVVTKEDTREDHPYYNVTQGGVLQLTTGIFDMAINNASMLAIAEFDKLFPKDE